MNINQFEDYTDSIYQSEEIDINDLPLNLLELAQKIWGINLITCNGLDENCSSYIAFKGAHCFMGYNAEESQEKTNLLCAHELVHYVLKHKTESHKGYGKKTRHNLNSIEKQADRYSRILLMPRYLVKKLKNTGFSQEQIIAKCGLLKNKEAGRKRLEELNMYKKTDIAAQKSLLEKTFEKDAPDSDIPYYPKSKIEDLILNRKSPHILRINKMLVKDADFATDLSGIEIDGETRSKELFGFINVQEQYSEGDLLLFSKDLKLYTSRKIQQGNKILGKIINYFRIPKPVIINVPVKTQQLSLFSQ